MLQLGNVLLESNLMIQFRHRNFGRTRTEGRAQRIVWPEPEGRFKVVMPLIFLTGAPKAHADNVRLEFVVDVIAGRACCECALEKRPYARPRDIFSVRDIVATHSKDDASSLMHRLIARRPRALVEKLEATVCRVSAFEAEAVGESLDQRRYELEVERRVVWVAPAWRRATPEPVFEVGEDVGPVAAAAPAPARSEVNGLHAAVAEGARIVGRIFAIAVVKAAAGILFGRGGRGGAGRGAQGGQCVCVSCRSAALLCSLPHAFRTHDVLSTIFRAGGGMCLVYV